MTPWMKQEKVSKMLADFRGSILYCSVISRATLPVVRMAIVLFAVQRLASETSAAMVSSAPRLPREEVVNTSVVADELQHASG